MKKFTLLFIVTLACTIAFGQYVQKAPKMQKIDDGFTAKRQTEFVSSKEGVWSNDFSVPADWLIGHVEGAEDADWIITTVATAPAGYIPVYGMSDAIESPTADNGFALFNSDITGAADGELQDAWIQIANPIDLSTLTAPRFVFNTYYKKFYDVISFEYSLDGGTTWVTEEIFAEWAVKDICATDYQYLLNVPDLGGENSVLFRFRVAGDWDYGLYIDDIFVTETPEYDLVLKSCAINFFDAVDYTVVGQEDYYHLSSHYGMIPDEILKNENAWMIFNAVVSNNGINSAFPTVDVTITAPDDTEVYTFTYVSDVELESGDQDTLAIAWGDAEDFNITEEDFQLGTYSVDFDLTIEGITDNNPENNAYSTYFEGTDNVYARDLNMLNSITGPGIWLDGDADGALMGVNYTFLESTVIDSVQAYVTSTSDAGTSLICHIMQFDVDSEIWVDIATSPLVNVEEENLGTWMNFTFTDPATVVLGGEETSISIKVALEFYYNVDGNSLWIGEDNEAPSSFWGTQWMLVGDDGWASYTNYTKSTPMIRAFVPPTLISVPQNFSQTDINMYPNPSTGIVTISNVEGASIEVVNLMGQVVATVENASEINNIDLSNQANGTYIVRIVNGNEISTSKLNLLK